MITIIVILTIMITIIVILIIIMTLPPEDQRLKGYSVCIFYAGYYEDYLLRTLFLLLLPEDQRV